MSTIKELVLATIEQHIDEQNAKGMKNYGQTLDDCPVDAYDWKNMIIEELIDGLQYQQKEIHKLQGDVKTAESFGEMYRLKYIQVTEGAN